MKRKINIYISRIGISLNKNSSLCYLDSSSLISSSKYDNVAQNGKSTRHGCYKGYKLHMVYGSSGIPICFSISTINVHDSKYDHLLEEIAKAYLNLTVFADKDYDRDNLINSTDSLEIFLMCPLNKSNTKNFKTPNLSNFRLRNYEFLSSVDGKKKYRKR